MRRIPKWWQSTKPWARCPVVMQTPIGPVQCEKNADYPHSH